MDADGTASFALRGPRSDRASPHPVPCSSRRNWTSRGPDPGVARRRRPELLFNQLTGGSNTTISTFTTDPRRGRVARGRLLKAAALELGEAVDTLTAKAGVITSALTGRSLGYGELAAKAASMTTGQVSVALKEPSDFKVIGTPQRASTHSKRSPDASGSRWTSRYRARCPRWCAARRPQRHGPLRGEPGGGAGTAGHHGRRHGLHRCRRARPHLRAVHRRGPRPRGRLGAGHRGGQVGRHRARRAAQGRTPAARPRSAHQVVDARSPSTSPATARWRPTARWPTCARTPPRSGPA